MLRIIDAQMNGTVFGTVILYVAPEACAGGPFAIVNTGDEIIFDGAARRLDLVTSDPELQTRLGYWQANPAQPLYARAYAKLYVQTVLQAGQGVDLAF